MPTTTQIENSEVLSASQALRLIAILRASEHYRDNKAAYPDLEVTIKAKINRRRTTTGASNTTPIVLTSNAHGFQNGELVTVQGVVGNSAANGVWVVANVSANTLELEGSAGSGAYTSGGELLDLASQHLAAIAAAVDDLGDGTVAVKGGRDGTDYSQSRDRESLVSEALDLLYSAEDSGAIVAVGQRGCSCGQGPRCRHHHGGHWS